MHLPFIKCHGSENDFILIDELELDFSFTEEERRELSTLLCDRHTGVGSDGILFVLSSHHADGKMRMFNSDGTEAEMCGNGLRCVARYLIEKQKASTIIIETLKADLEVSQVEEVFEGVDTFAVAIKPVSFNVSSLPMIYPAQEAIDASIPSLSDNRTFTAVSVPNPHVIAIVDSIDDAELELTGERANQLKEIFPKGVNVSFVQILGGNRIFSRTYERGVGLTNACGTAMSASSLVSTIVGNVTNKEPITVFNKGGFVHCVVHKEEERYTIQLRGNATYVYEAKLDVQLESRTFQIKEQVWFEEEKVKYEQLKQFARVQIGG